MFFVGFGIGFIIGANVALILYSIILVGKNTGINAHFQKIVFKNLVRKFGYTFFKRCLSKI